VLAILGRIEAGEWILVSSAVLEYELSRNPDAQRRARTGKLLLAAQERGIVGPAEIARAKGLIDAFGLRALDAPSFYPQISADLRRFLGGDGLERVFM